MIQSCLLKINMHENVGVYQESILFQILIFVFSFAFLHDLSNSFACLSSIVNFSHKRQKIINLYFNDLTKYKRTNDVMDICCYSARIINYNMNCSVIKTKLLLSSNCTVMIKQHELQKIFLNDSEKK